MQISQVLGGLYVVGRTFLDRAQEKSLGDVEIAAQHGDIADVVEDVRAVLVRHVEQSLTVTALPGDGVAQIAAGGPEGRVNLNRLREKIFCFPVALLAEAGHA